MVTLALAVDLKIVLAVAAFLLAIAGFAYKVYRDSLDKPKVQITAGGALVGLPGQPHYIVVHLANAGRRPVTLTKCDFQTAKSWGLMVIHPEDPLFDKSARFPVKLEEGGKAEVYIPRNAFAKGCSDPVVRFIAYDTTGRAWKSGTYPLGKKPITSIPVDDE